MKTIFLHPPGALDRVTHAAMLHIPRRIPYQRDKAVADNDGNQLDHLMLRRQTVRRGQGQTRSSDVASSSSTIAGAAVFSMPDCRKVVVDSSLAGTWRASLGRHVVQGDSCMGPAPDGMDPGRDPRRDDRQDCDPEEGCVEYSSSLWAKLQAKAADLTLTISAVAAAQGITRGNFAGYRKVRPCVAGSLTKGVDPDSSVRIRITNSTTNHVRFQAYTEVSGLSDQCYIREDIYDAEESTHDTSWTLAGNGKKVAWFYACIPPGRTIDAVILHRVVGGEYCCGLPATLSNWQYAYRCSSQETDGDCNPGQVRRFDVPLHDFRKSADFGRLPTSGEASNLYLDYSSQFGTVAPRLSTDNAGSGGAASWSARTQFSTGPVSLGRQIVLRVNAGMPYGVADSYARLKMEVVKVDAPTTKIIDETKDINFGTMEDYYFAAQPTVGISNDDVLDAKLTIEIEDGGSWSVYGEVARFGRYEDEHEWSSPTACPGGGSGTGVPE